MLTLKQMARPLISMILIGATALGLSNVYGDSSEVLALAQKVACRGSDCPTRTTRLERTPFAQEYDLAASITVNKQTATISTTVRCKRAYLLLGEWSCADSSSSSAAH